jgi:hypothetical protein
MRLKTVLRIDKQPSIRPKLDPKNEKAPPKTIITDPTPCQTIN